jgi:hypothetical protein
LDFDHCFSRSIRKIDSPKNLCELSAFARKLSTQSDFSQRRKGAKFAEILLKAAQFPAVGRNGDQSFKLGQFAISAIRNPRLFCYTQPDHCGADRVTARASVISNFS